MSDKYILDADGEPVPSNDLYEWGAWMQTDPHRRVALTEINGVKISTVFLGLNHQFGDGDPILWETMVFRGRESEEQDRCAGGRKDAEAMHARMVEKVKGQ